MNQRLREFERASHIDVYGLGKNRDQWKSALEKFAELIVRECAKIIETQDVDPSFKNRMSWAIKKHFGVEE